MSIYEDIAAAIVGSRLDDLKQRMHDGPLAERVGQRHSAFVEHDVAAAMTLEHCGIHLPRGFAQDDKAAPTADASVASMVAKHELHAAALTKIVGQTQSYSVEQADVTEATLSHCAEQGSCRL